MKNQLESSIMIDKTMVDQLKGNTQDYLTCEAEFHCLAKIDHLACRYILRSSYGYCCIRATGLY